MRAVRVEGGSIEVRDLPVPEPGEGQALVRMTTAGVCHSDLHLARGDWFGVQSEALGHEGIGVVEALGPGADRFVAVGDRVILGLGGAGGGYWCGACEYCLGGRPRLCDQGQLLMGTFAELFPVWAPSLVTVPDAVGDEEAPLACGGLTAYGAVKKLARHGIVSGRPIAVIGAAGGLGHYAVQLATGFGYRVVGVDLGAERLEFARGMGAEIVVDASDPAAAVAQVEQQVGGVDASLVFSAALAGFDLGMKLLRKGGLFVGVGLPATSQGNFELNPFELFMKDPTIIYSAVGTVQDMREVIDLAAAGRVKTHISRTGSLDDVPAIFDELEAGKYLGRAVLEVGG
ncbi:MAG TPA: zinc-binding dehydrogenase [Acidimicrobiales bacterium]